MDCINLFALYGERFKVEYDPAYNPGKTRKVNRDPFYMTLPCVGGVEIYPHGGSILTIETPTRIGSPIVKKLLKAGCTLKRDADDGCTLLFDVELFEAVAKIAKPRKKRKLKMTAEKQAVLNKARDTLSQREK